MNEYKAALETLQCKSSTNTDTCSANVQRRIKLCIRCDERKALHAIRVLVERATPKRPKKSIPLTKLDKFLGNQQLFICPTCGNSCLCRYATNGRNENKYCYDCGQAIDWGKEEAKKALEARKNEM